MFYKICIKNLKLIRLALLIIILFFIITPVSIYAAPIIKEYPGLYYTQSLTSGSDGALWAGSGGGSVYRMTVNGTLTNTFQLPTGGQPMNIVNGPDGALWFFDTATNSIGRMTTSGSLAEFPLPYASNNNGASNLVFAPNGDVWLALYYPLPPTADGTIYSGSTLIDMSEDGTIISQTQTPDGGVNPRFLTFNNQGDLWYSGVYKGTSNLSPYVYKMAQDKIVTSYITLDNGDWYPDIMIKANDGSISFSEQNVENPNISAIGHIDNNSNITQFNVPAASGVNYMTYANDGSIWFTEEVQNNQVGQSSVGQLKADGTVATYPLPTNGSGPNQIVQGSDGNIWLAETSKIAQVNITSELPQTPTGLVGPIVTNKAPSLQWNFAGNATSYNVYRNGTLIGNTVTNSFADSSLSTDGSYSYTVRSLSYYKKESGNSNLITVVYDTTPPSGTFTGNAAAIRFLGQKVTGTATDNLSGVAKVQIISGAVTLSSGTGGAIALSCTTATSCTWTADPTSLTTGSQTLTLIVTDAAGNTYQTTKSYIIL